jgi:hypothetical protein
MHDLPVLSLLSLATPGPTIDDRSTPIARAVWLRGTVLAQLTRREPYGASTLPSFSLLV